MYCDHCLHKQYQQASETDENRFNNCGVIYILRDVQINLRMNTFMILIDDSRVLLINIKLRRSERIFQELMREKCIYFEESSARSTMWARS